MLLDFYLYGLKRKKKKGAVNNSAPHLTKQTIFI